MSKVKLTAANSMFLKQVRASWNAPIMKRTAKLYNEDNGYADRALDYLSNLYADHVRAKAMRQWRNLAECDAYFSPELRTCACGEWPVSEYGERCPSCPQLTTAELGEVGCGECDECDAGIRCRELFVPECAECGQELTEDEIKDAEESENCCDCCADVDRHGVWCRVSGGVTGTRESWLKANGVRKTFRTRTEAMNEAHRLRNSMGQNSNATFYYFAKEIP